MPDQNPPVLGILGGMGPVVTAEFLKTIYQQGSWEKEQQAPNVIVFSLPSAPDRSTAIHGGDESAFIHFIAESLTKLHPLCDRIVIACCTAHFALPRVPAEVKSKVVSLIDLIHRQLEGHHEPALLLASTGAYQKRLFQGGQGGGQNILALSGQDQEQIHRMIYEVLKQGLDPMSIWPEVERLLEKYGTRSYIAGCTELHLLTKRLKEEAVDNVYTIDGLDLVSRYFNGLVTAFHR